MILWEWEADFVLATAIKWFGGRFPVGKSASSVRQLDSRMPDYRGQLRVRKRNEFRSTKKHRRTEFIPFDSTLRSGRA
jgi:hypothetical protein